MKKTTNEIVAQIRALLNELEGTSEEKITPAGHPTKKTPKKATGCSGAIQGLIDEGFFNSLKAISQVVEKLKEEGQPYSRELVSMNMLNLVKPPRRILRRIKENEQWKYIVRQ